jgi:hypothetical protein
MRFRQIVGAAIAAVLILSAPSAEAARRGFLNCVQYVKQATDFELSGNAWTWWGNAQGRYRTAQRPQEGAVLVFKRTKKMPYGHVAVVADVIDKRTIRIEHANWAPPGGRKGRVSSEMVKDISEANDWTLVRVEWKPAASFGRPYPTNGFILPDNARGMKGIAVSAPIPAVKPSRQSAPHRQHQAGTAPARQIAEAIEWQDAVPTD